MIPKVKKPRCGKDMGVVITVVSMILIAIAVCIIKILIFDLKNYPELFGGDSSQQQEQQQRQHHDGDDFYTLADQFGPLPSTEASFS